MARNLSSANSPSPSRMLFRGLLRRCPNCGTRGAFFVSWFRTQKNCRGCNLFWQRNLEGFMLGALAISFILTGGALITTLTIGVLLTYPNLAIVEILIATISTTLIVGIFGYPISYTTWLAIDLIMRPLDKVEQANTVNRK
ncbi:MAG: hypothetical protein EBS27_04630 [Actinobacteria bacterium]|nr:hypothetical protein [Actinomycetota bacterium]